MKNKSKSIILDTLRFSVNSVLSIILVIVLSTLFLVVSENIVWTAFTTQMSFLIVTYLIAKTTRDFTLGTGTFKYVTLMKSIGVGIATFVGLLLLSALIPVSGTSNTTEIVNSSTSPLLGLIFPIMLAPICEELFFRGALKHFTDSKYIYLILQPLLFGLMHIQDLSLFSAVILLNTFVSGFVLSYVYLKTDNIVYPIAIHMTYNLLTLITTSAI